MHECDINADPRAVLAKMNNGEKVWDKLRKVKDGVISDKRRM